MEKFKVNRCKFENLLLLERLPLVDQRGFFERLYCRQTFESLGINDPIAQINRSYTSKKGSVRGLHYQIAPVAEGKIVTCLRGEIFDVAIDLRRSSATFLDHFECHLSDKNSRSIFIPPGFAHGFQTLTDNCELIYFHTEQYSQVYERGLNPKDPALRIKWPLEFQDISERDSNHPLVDDSFTGV